MDWDIWGTFSSKSERKTVRGFYDGDGVYRVRFMPSFDEVYEFEVRGTFSDEAVRGSFSVRPPSPGNHGPVRVANRHHFAYEDGTPHFSFGTTCYAWAMQPDGRIEETLRTLEGAPFNKLRFCVFPKHYDYNLSEPATYPYEGTPVDSSGLTSENFSQYTGRTEGNRWDFTRFNPAHFRRLEACVLRLRDLGIEADLIGMHPYDRWGFSRMTPAQDDLYWRYLVARFAAFRNVWWSLANEYDLMPQKSIADWERFARILCEEDPYGHLRSIHNCLPFYDHTRPWITHASIQRQDLYRTTEYVDEWRVRYGKPVVCDEIAYEGDIQHGWGNISPEELTRRFWEAVLRGGYAGHGDACTRAACSGGRTAARCAAKARRGLRFCERPSRSCRAGFGRGRVRLTRPAPCSRVLRRWPVARSRCTCTTTASAGRRFEISSSMRRPRIARRSSTRGT